MFAADKSAQKWSDSEQFPYKIKNGNRSTVDFRQFLPMRRNCGNLFVPHKYQKNKLWTKGK
jgi:hypothetical protein